MKVENHNDIGNPYHDDNTGEFSSKNGGSNPLYKKKNAPLEEIRVKPLPFRNDNGQKMNIKPNQAEQDLKRSGTSFDDIEMLKKHDLFDAYKQKYGPKAQKQGKIDPSLINQNSLLQARMDFEHLKEVLSTISNLKFMRVIHFIVSGFDFSKLKGRKLSEKVFKPTKSQTPPIISPEKQMEAEKKDLRKEGMSLLDNYKKKVDNFNIQKQDILNQKAEFEKKFGKSKKMFQKWWAKSNLKKMLIKNQVAQEQAAIDFNRQKKMYKDKLKKSIEKENKMKGIE